MIEAEGNTSRQLSPEELKFYQMEIMGGDLAPANIAKKLYGSDAFKLVDGIYNGSSVEMEIPEEK